MRIARLLINNHASPGAKMNSLSAREKSLIKREFNQGGYVLKFSNSTFADFAFDCRNFDELYDN